MSQMIQRNPLFMLNFALPINRFVSWLRSNFCRAAAFVSVLMFGYDVVHYSVSDILIIYLVGNGEPNGYGLAIAAIIVTAGEGISASLGIVVAYLLDALVSRLKIISCCVVSTIVGLVLLIIGDAHGHSAYFIIPAVIFLAVGADVRTQVQEFLHDQLRAHELVTNPDRDLTKIRKRVWWIVSWLCSVGATFLISNYSWRTSFIFSWKIYFISSTSVLAGTFVLFLCGIYYYHNRDFTGTGSSLFNFVSVVKASLLKKHLPYPTSPDLFYQNNGNETHLSPQVKILRPLDKAAIIENSNLNPEQQVTAGRLCTVTQVKESKLLLKMIPMWTTFLVFGLVASTGKTFSSEQGSETSATNFTFYVVIFLRPISQRTLSYIFDKLPLARLSVATNRLAKLLRIWIGMVLCIIFCVVAWRVEARRLQQDGNISIFWLAPQYCLIGFMESYSSDGLDEFMIDELPESLKNYASAMNKFVIDGIGSFLSILFMLRNKSLFNSSLNDSRLDKYYMRLMIWSVANMCYYCIISTIYTPICYPEAEMA